jgi:recombination protein RecT
LYAKTVHEGDEFIQEYGLSPKLVHKPGAKQGKMIAVYAVAHLNGGGEVFEVLTYEDVERLRVRNASQRGNPSGAWASDYEEMAKAKAVKRLAKYLPLSDEMLHAGVADDAFIPDSALSNNNSGIDAEELTYEIEIEPETEKEQGQ